MTLSRNVFFLSLLLICISPFVIWKLIWLSNTTVTTGKVWFTGHTIELDGSISSHLVIHFMAGTDSVNFQAPSNVPFKEGQNVPVRYVSDDPSNARINTAIRIWGDAMVFGMWPVLVLLVIFLMPESLDPLIPRKSKILIGKKNFISVVRA